MLLAIDSNVCQYLTFPNLMMHRSGVPPLVPRPEGVTCRSYFIPCSHTTRRQIWTQIVMQILQLMLLASCVRNSHWQQCVPISHILRHTRFHQGASPVPVHVPVWTAGWEPAVRSRRRRWTQRRDSASGNFRTAPSPCANNQGCLSACKPHCHRKLAFWGSGTMMTIMTTSVAAWLFRPLSFQPRVKFHWKWT